VTPHTTRRWLFAIAVLLVLITVAGLLRASLFLNGQQNNGVDGLDAVRIPQRSKDQLARYLDSVAEPQLSFRGLRRIARKLRSRADPPGSPGWGSDADAPGSPETIPGTDPDTPAKTQQAYENALAHGTRLLCMLRDPSTVSMASWKFRDLLSWGWVMRSDSTQFTIHQITDELKDVLDAKGLSLDGGINVQVEWGAFVRM
jgi:hypothetical protein